MFRKTLALLLLFALVLAQDDEFVDDVVDEATDEFSDAEEATGEAAEFAEEEGDEASEEVAAAADAAVADFSDVEEVPMTLEAQMAQEDLWILLIGISACLDTLWWILWGMFIYIKTNPQDSTLCVNSDCVTQIVPLAWFWNAFAHTTLSWTALTYFWIFMFYMLVSVPELVFWIMHMIEKDNEQAIGHWLFNMWASYVGLYGSWVLYFFPVLFPLIQITALSGINQAGYLNAVVQLVMMMITWLFTGIVHVLGFPYVNKKFARWNNFPSVLPGATEEEAVAEVANVADDVSDADAEPVEEFEEGLDEAEDAADDASEALDDAVEEADEDGADW